MIVNKKSRFCGIFCWQAIDIKSLHFHDLFFFRIENLLHFGDKAIG